MCIYIYYRLDKPWQHPNMIWLLDTYNLGCMMHKQCPPGWLSPGQGWDSLQVWLTLVGNSSTWTETNHIYLYYVYIYIYTHNYTVYIYNLCISNGLHIHISAEISGRDGSTKTGHLQWRPGRSFEFSQGFRSQVGYGSTLKNRWEPQLNWGTHTNLGEPIDSILCLYRITYINF